MGKHKLDRIQKKKIGEAVSSSKGEGRFHRFFVMGTVFELSLVLVAWVLAQFSSNPDLLPLRMGFEISHVSQIFFYLLPMMIFGALFFSPATKKVAFTQEIFEQLRKILGPHLKDLRVFELFLLSLAAGFGEEVLFRGILQPMTTLFIASVIFGALHSITLAYFVIATVIGYYLGFVYEATGTLVVPIMVHALYDFFALIYLKKKFQSLPTISKAS